MAAGGRIEQQTADGSQYETADYTVFIADFADQITHRDRHNRISGKETELNQHRLNISQFENIFQVRNQNIVHAGNETHHEEECGQNDQRRSMILL